MVPSSSRPYAVASLLDDDPDVMRLAAVADYAACAAGRLDVTS